MSILRAEPAEAVDPAWVPDGSLSLAELRSAFRSWLTDNAAAIGPLLTPHPDFGDRVAAVRELQGLLYDAGWARIGWPTSGGGLGGTGLHRGVIHEELAAVGWHGPANLEHLEIIAPTLITYATPELLSSTLPRFLDGTRPWVQGFSEPEAGSDLASLRTRGVLVDGGILVTGHKIWTTWAKWGRECLALVRTGTPEDRHRGLTMVAIDLDAPGIDVRPFRQANGTEEFAEVFFDDVLVPPHRIVGEVGGGWGVAMYLLARERGTLAWFRHGHFADRLRQGALQAGESDDAALGAALVQIAGLRATAGRLLATAAAGRPIGPEAAFTKLLMTRTEQGLYDALLRVHGPRLALGSGTDDDELLHQEYLFSRAVTIYGGTQQMQLLTIASRVLGLGR